jgi:hypothetical protein
VLLQLPQKDNSQQQQQLSTTEHNSYNYRKNMKANSKQQKRLQPARHKYNKKDDIHQQQLLDTAFCEVVSGDFCYIVGGIKIREIFLTALLPL